LLTIKGLDLARAVKAGCINLEHRRDEVDLLNVFPVPDGDTGTNMYLTLLSAVKEAEKHAHEPLGKVAKAISGGSLMGARGNSGVILSQIFRGFARVLENKEEANAADLAAALKAGAETAYKAVMKPVEGTILTIIRETAAASEAEAKKNDDIVSVMVAGVKQGCITLEKTPAMLPILKEAGVVDAGGQGLLFFLQGFVQGLANQEEIKLDFYPQKAPEKKVEIKDEDVSLEFQYCTETLIKGKDLSCDDIKDHLRPLGNSMLVVGGDDLVKVHIHSNHPGKVLETCLQFGSLSDIKINNMLEEVHERRLNFAEGEEANNKQQGIGLVAVASGEGVIEILESLGVNEIVSGGQTMNPSTEDLLTACNRVKADNIIILPNNSNIIMTAEQVKELIEKNIVVLPTKSVMQAITALIAFDPEGQLDEVAGAMEEEMSRVAYAEITTAVRDSSVNSLDIKEGDFLGLLNGQIYCSSSDIKQVFAQLLPAMVNEDSQLITLLYGENEDPQRAEEIKAYLEDNFDQCEVELHYGGQSHYYYLLSVE